jgi:hypothetical protein
MPRFAQRAVLLFICSVGLAVAADESGPANDSASNVPQEPEVTIIQRGQERIEEYRMNNRVYMVKVTPAKGYPYYLVDTTGDGNFDTRRTGLDPKVSVPQWVLFRWK